MNGMTVTVAMKVLVEPRAKNAEPLVPEACEEQGSDDDANTLSALCRPGLFLGIDDSELFQRERCGRGLSAPTNIDYHGYVIIKEPPPSPCQWIRVNGHYVRQCIHQQNGGQHSRLLVARYTMITLTAEYDAGI